LARSELADLKAKLEPVPLVEIPIVEEPPVVEIKLSAEVVKLKKAVASPIDKLISDGTIVDEEDAYWLGQALAENEPEDEMDLPDEEAVPEDHPLYHQSGSWRAEGFKSIPKTRKSEYLPQQNKAAVAEQDAAALTSGRTARVTGRRLAHDIETTRRATTAQTSETDTFAFNQLRTRKKQLKFSRSPIEGYGLYAMETIVPGEMVCEYVGEIVRSAIAEVREQRYLKQGIGSSYLFRIDGDVVCDATFRGSVR
jgi:histone-lysine N-methyltransferase SETD1